MNGHGAEEGGFVPRNAEEALQYTPFTSVVPLRTDAIPLPMLQPLGAGHTFDVVHTLQEREKADNRLKKLNAEAARSPESPLVSEYLNELQGYLAPGELTSYAFKTPSASITRSAMGITPADGSATILPPQMGGFEELLLNRTNVPFIYPGALTPPSIHGDEKTYSVHDNSSHSQSPATSTKSLQQPHPPQPQPMTPTHPKTEPIMAPLSASGRATAVMISTPKQFDKSAYFKDEALDKRLKVSKPIGYSAESKSRKRKRSYSLAGEEDSVAPGVDKRAKADALVQTLTNILNSIFEADDNLQPDTSGVTVQDHTAKYWLTSSLDSRTPCLSTSIQTRLENSIRNVIEVDRFNSIPVEEVYRAEKLCYRAILKYESRDFKLPQSADGVESWVHHADELDNGLKTARTILRMMIGGREEKQIYSEDILLSTLRFLKQLSEDLMVPLVELRSTGNTADLFKALSGQKKVLGGIIQDLGYLFMMISRLITKEQISEDAITTLEYTMLPVIFMEGATTEKDSVFGIQRVERFRVCSMEVLEKIFAQYTSQHQFLFDYILSSLEKLHVNKKAQRQFKLDDGKNIMLVSALVVRLVQASSGYHAPKSERIMKSDEDGEDEGDEDEGKSKKPKSEGISMLDPSRNPGEVIQKLTSICHPLLQVAQRAAHYVVNFMMQRAMGATKTGESPYRSLMDLFVEDFITLLGRPDWPGTELMLNQIFLQSVRLIDDKSPSTAKQMGLEYLGLLGSGIVDLLRHTKDYRHRLEATDYGSTPTSEMLITLGEKYAKEGVTDDMALYDWQGPCRAVVEFLLDDDSQDKNHQSATDYLLTVWGEKIVAAYEKVPDTDESTQIDYAHTGAALCKLIVEHTTVDDEFGLETKIQADLASRIYILNSDLCRHFDYLINKLIKALENDQPTIRTRALKSIMELITKDNALLERKALFPAILSRCSDNSSLVRDAALDLVGKIISLRPKLEADAFLKVVDRTSDTGVVVRKRAIKLLRDIYLRDNPDIENCRARVSEAVLQRNKDQDTTVVDLARKTLEEIWITPCHSALRKSEEAEIANDPRVRDSVNMMMHIVKKGEEKAKMLTELIYSFIVKDIKTGPQNFKVFKAMVAHLFAQLLEVSDSERARRQYMLLTLTTFAKASAKLFNNDQLIQLQPYTENLVTPDDFAMYRWVVVIYKNVFPSVHSFQHSFLESISVSLLKNLSKSPPKGVKEAVECLWSINKVLNNPNRIIAVTKSCMTKIVRIPVNCAVEQAVFSAIRVFNILGALGMICDFTPNLEEFRALVPHYKGNSVPELLAQVTLPYTVPTANPQLRKAALECLGSICQTHGSLFLSEKVLQSLDKVFAGDDKDLKNLVVDALKGFLQLQESISASSLLQEEANKKDATDVPEGGRLAIQHNATQEDGVSTSLAQRYLNNIISIAEGSLDSYATTATEVIGSILRQGLVHPKTCTAALVVLETSSVPVIGAIAFAEHNKLNHKHEAIIERGYMEGVKKCFTYQRDVIKNKSGAITSTQPYSPVLHRLWDILTDGNKKFKQKFLGNIVQSMDFDPASLKKDLLRGHLDYVRFITENVAYFDYKEMGDVYKVVSAMEMIASSTGVAIQHAVETEVMMIGKERKEGETLTCDPETLIKHALASACLSCMWSARSFLRKLYSLNEQKVRDFRRNKLAAKDLNRPATKLPFQNSAPVVEEVEKIMSGLETTEDQLARCYEFVEFLKVDNEFKPAEDEEEFNVEKTPDDETGDEEDPVTGASPNKRKRKAPADSPAVKKPRRKANPKLKKQKTTVVDFD